MLISIAVIIVAIIGVVGIGGGLLQNKAYNIPLFPSVNCCSALEEIKRGLEVLFEFYC